jgi:hypothetical protein
MDTPSTNHSELLLGSDLFEPVKQAVLVLLAGGRQPSAWDMLGELQTKLGLKARWELTAVLEVLAQDTKELTQAQRDFCGSLRKSEDLTEALRGADAPKKEIKSTISVGEGLA